MYLTSTVILALLALTKIQNVATERMQSMSTGPVKSKAYSHHFKQVVNPVRSSFYPLALTHLTYQQPEYQHAGYHSAASSGYSGYDLHQNGKQQSPSNFQMQTGGWPSEKSVIKYNSHQHAGFMQPQRGESYYKSQGYAWPNNKGHGKYMIQQTGSQYPQQNGYLYAQQGGFVNPYQSETFQQVPVAVGSKSTKILHQEPCAFDHQYTEGKQVEDESDIIIPNESYSEDQNSNVPNDSIDYIVKSVEQFGDSQQEVNQPKDKHIETIFVNKPNEMNGGYPLIVNPTEGDNGYVYIQNPSESTVGKVVSKLPKLNSEIAKNSQESGDIFPTLPGSISYEEISNVPATGVPGNKNGIPYYPDNVQLPIPIENKPQSTTKKDQAFDVDDSSVIHDEPSAPSSNSEENIYFVGMPSTYPDTTQNAAVPIEFPQTNTNQNAAAPVVFPQTNTNQNIGTPTIAFPDTTNSIKSPAPVYLFPDTTKNNNGVPFVVDTSQNGGTVKNNGYYVNYPDTTKNNNGVPSVMDTSPNGGTIKNNNGYFLNYPDTTKNNNGAPSVVDTVTNQNGGTIKNNNGYYITYPNTNTKNNNGGSSVLDTSKSQYNEPTINSYTDKTQTSSSVTSIFPQYPYKNREMCMHFDNNYDNFVNELMTMLQSLKNCPCFRDSVSIYFKKMLGSC